MAKITFCPGNARLTRRVKKLAAAAGVQVDIETEWNGYGRKIVAYKVEDKIYKQARDEVDPGWEERERRAAEEREAARLASEQQRADELATACADVASRCPWLSDKRVNELSELYFDKLFNPFGKPWRSEEWLYDNIVAVPHGQYTREQWRRLGYRVRRSARPVGYVIGDRRLMPLYVRTHASPARKPVDPRPAWAYLLKHYGGDETLALSRSIWMANRLAKIESDLKGTFYGLKDRFLTLYSDCLVEGRVAPVEQKSCWGCEGTGVYQGRTRHDDWDEEEEYDDSEDTECWRCNGTGVYSRSILYEWRLDIGGRPYCFHSYTKPPVISDMPGADLQDYGMRFTDADLVGLPAVPLGYYLPAIRFRIEELEQGTAVTKEAV